VSTLHRQKRADQLPLANADDAVNILGMISILKKELMEEISNFIQEGWKK
jgi:hypothetical protein